MPEHARRARTARTGSRAARRSAPSLRPGAYPDSTVRLQGNSSSSQLVAKYSGVSKLSLGLSSSAPSPRSAASRSRRASGAPSPLAAERDRRREFGAQHRFEVAGDQHGEQLVRGDAKRVGADLPPSIQRPLMAPPPIRRTSLARSPTGWRVMCAHARTSAQLSQHARDRRERRQVERFRSVRGHDRVEHERRDAVGVGLRVALGHLRAVGGAVQHELFVAARLPDRLDVGDGVGGRVVAAGRADLGGAFGELLSRRARPRRVRSDGTTAGARGRCRAGRTRSDRAWPRSARAGARTVRRTGSPPAPGRPRARSRACALPRPARDGGASPA